MAKTSNTIFVYRFQVQSERRGNLCCLFGAFDSRTNSNNSTPTFIVVIVISIKTKFKLKIWRQHDFLKINAFG